MTPARKRVLDFIELYIAENSYAPTYEEIASGCAYASLATVSKHLDALETEGAITRQRGDFGGIRKNRSISLTKSPDRVMLERGMDLLKQLHGPLIGALRLCPLCERASVCVVADLIREWDAK